MYKRGTERERDETERRGERFGLYKKQKNKEKKQQLSKSSDVEEY